MSRILGIVALLTVVSAAFAADAPPTDAIRLKGGSTLRGKITAIGADLTLEREGLPPQNIKLAIVEGVDFQPGDDIEKRRKDLLLAALRLKQAGLAIDVSKASESASLKAVADNMDFRAAVDQLDKLIKDDKTARQSAAIAKNKSADAVRDFNNLDARFKDLTAQLQKAKTALATASRPQDVQEVCPACNGAKYVYRYYNNYRNYTMMCRRCGGTGQITVKKLDPNAKAAAQAAFDKTKSDLDDVTAKRQAILNLPKDQRPAEVAAVEAKDAAAKADAAKAALADQQSVVDKDCEAIVKELDKKPPA